MPELPEVDYFCTFLNKHVRTYPAPEITKVEVLRQNGSYDVSWMISKKIRHFARFGKKISIYLDGIEEYAVVSHAMTGYWSVDDESSIFDYVEGKRKNSQSDVRVEFTLSTPGSKKKVRFHDARLFGSIKRVKGFENMVRGVGPDILETVNSISRQNWRAVFDEAIAKRRYRRTKKLTTIKELLMEQDLFSGIGNIYASEGLFRAGVRPGTNFIDMTNTFIYEVYESCEKVMHEALKRGLKYDGCLNVYREKECKTCVGVIMNETIGGRSSYFCPKCQR